MRIWQVTAMTLLAPRCYEALEITMSTLHAMLIDGRKPGSIYLQSKTTT